MCKSILDVIYVSGFRIQLGAGKTTDFSIVYNFLGYAKKNELNPGLVGYDLDEKTEDSKKTVKECKTIKKTLGRVL